MPLWMAGILKSMTNREKEEGKRKEGERGRERGGGISGKGGGRKSEERGGERGGWKERRKEGEK